MQEREKKHLPQLTPKSISLHSVFDLIKKKKHQFSNILKNTDRNDHLPKIQKDQMSKEQEISTLQLRSEEKEENDEHFDRFLHTPVKHYRTILQPGSLSQEKLGKEKQFSALKIDSKHKEYETAGIIREESYSQVKRIKTEGQHIARKATNTTQIESHREQEISEVEFDRIQQAKDKFMEAIHLIPKAIKLRKESNLLGVVEPLEIFNPFANRNDRMVNICLLKMGKVILCQSSVLYKIGEELDYFYIILLGKVKLTNGALRKICQTGETLLQQIIFSDKLKKIALERAKVIGQAVLLELKVEGLQKLKEELIRFGFKLGYQEMESIIKRNHIVKNWLRNKIRLESNR